MYDLLAMTPGEMSKNEVSVSVCVCVCVCVCMCVGLCFFYVCVAV